jgi:hypothetical protein
VTERRPSAALFLGVALWVGGPGACARPTPPPSPGAARAAAAPVEPLPTAMHTAAAAAAAARVPDPRRGGPPYGSDASPLPPFLGVSRASARYVGTPVCAACHPGAASVHVGSAHGHALQTLVKASAATSPACLSCHVTGFGHPGGWAGAASLPGLDAVGCESCHGPGSDHVAAGGGANGYGALPSDASACVSCHTHDTSPDFRFEARWPAVAHGDP